MFVANRWKFKSEKEEHFNSSISNFLNPEIGEIIYWMPLPKPPKKG
jgi:hypothetical protein